MRKLILGVLLLLVHSIFCTTNSTNCTLEKTDFKKIIPQYNLDIIENILADDLEALDSSLVETISELKRRKAHLCWHKHSSFLQHLVGVFGILKLWSAGAPDGGVLISRVGLLHSAYSNSYVNLALFDPHNITERELMRTLVGSEVEDIVHLFCIIDRQAVVVDTLLAQGHIPMEGLNVPHLRDSGEEVYLSPEMLLLLVVFTMADIADQYFGWQDELFGFEENGNLMLMPDDEVSKHASNTMWPGQSRPGLWLNYVSSLGAVARTYKYSSTSIDNASTAIPLPPIFNNCSDIISLEDEVEARDLYWSVVNSSNNNLKGPDDATIIEILKRCIQLNPYVFEPFVMLAQKYLHAGMLEEAQEAAERALALQHLWSVPWDKRLGFPAWVAWTRVLLQHSKQKKQWPSNSWEVNNFGLVM